MWTALVRYRSHKGGTIFVSKRLASLEELPGFVSECKLNKLAVESILLNFNHNDPSVSAEDDHEKPCWEDPAKFCCFCQRAFAQA